MPNASPPRRQTPKPVARASSPEPSATPGPDPEEVAREAGLRYVSDARPGITRRRSGRGWSYRAPDGTLLRDAKTLARIRGLAIPPAWSDVWISPRVSGHMQATGRDARGRKQYRYHARWRVTRDEAKYDRTIAFAEALPAIRARVEADLGLRGLPRDKVLAAIVRLLEVTFIRVGNAEYARDNRSYGLTTMRDKHAVIDGSEVTFKFRGKSGRDHKVDIRDRRLATIVRRCQELPGQELFQYIDEEGQVQDVSSTDVNEYLRQVTGQTFTAKDFRTWAGTVLAAQALRTIEGASGTERELRSNVVRAVEQVAQSLGNTPTVCRQCYVHPAIIEAYLDGAMVRTARKRADERLASASATARTEVTKGRAESVTDDGTTPEEKEVLRLLRDRLAAAEGDGATAA
ncbi:MAG: DNA topoisomerase IB [Chloroflexota bacterium]|nr:DNA topoisomerase IB [Chloroflexota bacterium]